MKKQTTLTLLVGALLASSFWVVTLTIVHAAPMTPAELIQSELPAGKTMANATDAQVLEAVCKAVKKAPKQAALIVRTAAGARSSLKGDILCTAARCSREHHALDCSWVIDIVRDWMKADPSNASRLTEMVVECAPDCRDMLQPGLGEGNFVNPPLNINPPPGSSGGGSGGDVCLVCHNGDEIQVACSNLEHYLEDHPGDTAGPCQPTPTTNQ